MIVTRLRSSYSTLFVLIMSATLRFQLQTRRAFPRVTSDYKWSVRCWTAGVRRKSALLLTATVVNGETRDRPLSCNLPHGVCGLRRGVPRHVHDSPLATQSVLSFVDPAITRTQRWGCRERLRKPFERGVGPQPFLEVSVVPRATG